MEAWKFDLEWLISAGSFWFACQRSDEKQNIRMHQIRMRTFGYDLRTFGYEQRTIDSIPNSDIQIKWTWALRSKAKFIRRTCVELNQLLLSLTQARRKCDLDSDVEFVLDLMKY